MWENERAWHLPGVSPVGTWSPEGCWLSVWWPMCWPSVLLRPLSTTGQSPKSSSGTRLCSFRATEGCQCIRREGLPKADTLLTLGLDSPQEFPDVPLCYRPALGPTDQERGSSREFRRITSSCLRSCPSANVPNKLQKQTRISIRVLQPCNSTLKLQGFFTEV